METLEAMPIGTLIDRFNIPCWQDDCRFTTHKVSDDWCPKHQRLWREIKRREDAIVAPPPS